jgi:hypothetical protein
LGSIAIISVFNPKKNFWLLIVAASLVGEAVALDEIPQYEPVDIGGLIRAAYPTAGISSAWAVNESGDTVGAALIDGEFHAFVYTEAWGLEILPALPGWTNHIAQDVSDRDAQGVLLIVGGAGQTTLLSNSDPGHSVMWRYDTAQGLAEIVDVGHLPGNGVSELTAVNNNGWAVGYSRQGLTSGFYEPMVYEAATGILHPLALTSAPVNINDANQVLAGTARAQLSRDPATGVISVGSVDDLSAAPGRVASRTTGLNDLGWASGVTSMGYSDGAGRMVTGAVLYDEVSGPADGNWDAVWFGSAFDAGHGLNIHGDVVGDRGISAAIRATLYVRAKDQAYLLSDLTDPPFYSSSARDINDAGWIAGGAAGAVLWKRIGDLPVPSAPTDLTAVPHEPHWVHPWNAITVSWTDTSNLDSGFFLERRVVGTSTWTEILSNVNIVSYWDTDVGLGVTYEYRVRGRGLAGFSDYSNTASATAPDTPVDTEAPTVTITEPADGAQVSGRVSIRVTASDNVAVTNMWVDYSGPSGYGSICNGVDVTLLQCSWNTRKLRTGTYTLNAGAADALGNGTNTGITVELVDSGSGGGGGGGGGGDHCHPKKGC